MYLTDSRVAQPAWHNQVKYNVTCATQVSHLQTAIPDSIGTTTTVYVKPNKKS